jgi:hypothetical protein
VVRNKWRVSVTVKDIHFAIEYQTKGSIDYYVAEISGRTQPFRLEPGDAGQFGGALPIMVARSG